MAKILIYTLVFPPDQVSTAYVLGNLARGLRERGHDIKVLATTPHYQPPGKEKNIQPLEPYLGDWILKSYFEGIPCYHIKVPTKKGGIFQRLFTSIQFLWYSVRFSRQNEMKCDVVIAFTPPPIIGLIASKISTHYGARSIFSVGDLVSELFKAEKRWSKKILGRIIQSIETAGFRRCDAVVGVTPSSVEYIRSQTKDSQITEVIPDSVDTNLYYPLPRDNKYSQQQGWGDSFVVSYVGNFGQAQDFSPLPQVVSACSDLDAKFICVGGGLKYDELAKTAEKLGNPQWEIWGYQPIETTAMINASSDLCLILLDIKVTRGSFPSKLYTIMACARPVLYYGPCNSDIARLIQENDLGWTVETGDIGGFVQAVREAHVNSERRERMGRNGLKLVEKMYSSQVIAQKYHELIERVLTTNKNAPHIVAGQVQPPY